MTAAFSLLSVLFFVAANGQRYDNLYTTLLSNQPLPTIPMTDENTPVTVKIGLTLTNVLQLNTEEMMIDTIAWVSLRWRDERFSWDPALFGVQNIILPQNRMWKPDIVLYNGQQKTSIGDLHAVVTYDGGIFTVNPTQFSSHCSVDDDDNSIIECKLKLGSWVYNGQQLDLRTEGQSDAVDLSNYQDNPKWTLLNATAQRNDVYYACCPENYPDVEYTLRFQKRSSSQ